MLTSIEQAPTKDSSPMDLRNMRNSFACLNLLKTLGWELFDTENVNKVEIYNSICERSSG